MTNTLLTKQYLTLHPLVVVAADAAGKVISISVDFTSSVGELTAKNADVLTDPDMVDAILMNLPLNLSLSYNPATGTSWETGQTDEEERSYSTTKPLWFPPDED